MNETITAPKTSSKANGTTIPNSRSNLVGPFIKGTYVSGDDINRLDAREMGYETVCQHPNEVGVLGSDDQLVIDGDRTLFNDLDAVLKIALEAIRTGLKVGIHTYNPERLPLAGLTALPEITIAKTHRLLRIALG